MILLIKFYSYKLKYLKVFKIRFISILDIHKLIVPINLISKYPKYLNELKYIYL